MEGSKTLFCSPVFHGYVKEFLRNLQTRPKKGSPALGYINYSLPALQRDSGPHSDVVAHTVLVNTRLFLCYTQLYEESSKSKVSYYNHVVRFSALSWQASAQLVHAFGTRYQQESTPQMTWKDKSNFKIATVLEKWTKEEMRSVIRFNGQNISTFWNLWWAGDNVWW
jgi:hypothetical protein